MFRNLTALFVLGLLLVVPGCSLSRADQLARQSDRVESHLVKERDRVMAMSPGAGDRSDRLGHINSLHTQLTVADVARKMAPRLLQDPAQVESAYDVLEEVYSTIDWNIPLAPSDAARKPMPALFGPTGLDFSSLQMKAK